MLDKIYNIRKFKDTVVVELYDSKQKGVWEQITLKMIEIIEKHSLAYTNKYLSEK